MLLRFYVVASHALLLPSLFFTLKRFKKLWLEFIIVLQIFFWSLAYHLCYQYEFCFIERRLHQIYDDFFSLLAIPMAVLYILKIDNIIIKGPFILIAANLNAALISGFDMGLKGDLVFLVINIYAGLMVHLVVEECKNIHWTIIGVVIFILSVIFLGIAIHSFITPTTGDDEYFETHSLWHTFIFLGMFAMFKLRFPTHNDKILEEKLRNRDGDVCQFFFKYICCCGRSGRVARGAARHSNGSYNSVEHEEGSANSLNVFYKNRRKTEFGI